MQRFQFFNDVFDMNVASGGQARPVQIASIILITVLATLPIRAPAAQPPEQPLGLPPVPRLENNPFTVAKARLGAKLFKDQRLSQNNQIACASCHIPSNSFTDGQPIATGVNGKLGTRNAPTILNVIYYTSFFWDGRRERLKKQALDPLVNIVEHGLDNYTKVLKTIRNDPEYRRFFANAFSEDPKAFSMENVGKAIASYEQTKVTGNSPFDRWWSDRSYTYPSAAERGSSLFFVTAGCHNCHTMNMGGQSIFTDNKFHNLGVGFKRIEDDLPELIRAYRAMKKEGTTKDIDEEILTNRKISELGRFVVTLNKKDIGAFKTPILRNISETGPYMHDGSQKTLREVVEFYDKGGNPNPYLDSEMKPLHLTEQATQDLVAFLKSLTSPDVRESSHSD